MAESAVFSQPKKVPLLPPPPPRARTEPRRARTQPRKTTPLRKNVLDLQKRVVGVLPIAINIPRAGNSYRFVRPLVVDEETRLTFSLPGVEMRRPFILDLSLRPPSISTTFIRLAAPGTMLTLRRGTPSSSPLSGWLCKSGPRFGSSGE